MKVFLENYQGNSFSITVKSLCENDKNYLNSKLSSAFYTYNMKERREMRQKEREKQIKAAEERKKNEEQLEKFRREKEKLLAELQAKKRQRNAPVNPQDKMPRKIDLPEEKKPTPPEAAAPVEKKKPAPLPAPEVPQKPLPPKKKIAVQIPDNVQHTTMKYPPHPAAVATALVILALLNAVFYTACLWISMTITKCESSFMVLLISSLISALVSLIPYAGIILAGPLQIIIIMWMSRTQFLDTFFMVIVANLLFILASFAVIGKIMSFVSG